MTSITLAPGVEIDVDDFFPGTDLTDNEILKNLISQTGSFDLLGIGEVVSHFGEYVVELADGRTIRYVGDFVSTVVQGLLGSSSGVTGSISEIIIEEAGDVIASLGLDELLDVDLGEVTSLGLLGLNLEDVTGGLLGDLLGDTLGGVLEGVDEPVDTLLDEIQNLLDDIIGGGGGGGTPTGGDDTLIGGGDDDDIDGLGGNDVIYGGGGNDTLHGGDGNDVLVGGTGNDRLYGDDGDDILYGGPGRDRLYGGAGNDQLYGEGANDLLFGEAGNDQLTGSEKRDRLNGGADDDVLTGNRGRDILTGGDGADTFVFLTVGDSRRRGGVDFIRDFDQAEGDLLDLRELGEVDFIGRQRFSHDAGELRITRNHGDTILQADMNGDGKVDFSVRIDGRIRLTEDDFML